MRTSSKIIGFVLIFALSLCVMSYLLTPPSGIRILLAGAKEGDYSVLIMGQSHAECGYNPYIISDGLGKETVSVARRITPINNIYYILEEANVSGKYDTVILDIDPYYWILDQTRDLGSDMNLMPHLSGARRYRYFRSAIWPDTFIKLCCDYALTWDNILRIPDCISAKMDKNYIECNDQGMLSVNHYLKSDSAFVYEGRGFLRGINRAPELGWDLWQFDGSIEPDNLYYLTLMKQYCDDNNIRLICVQSALPPNRLLSQNMGDVHDYFDNLLGDMGIEFYDFNYGKLEYLYRSEEDYVDMDGHMMGDIADRQSKLLTDVITSDDKESYFYNNYDETLSAISNSVQNVY